MNAPQKTAKSNKLLLDTSVQIERLKEGSKVKEHLNQLKNGNKLYSSFFVLYEYKSGLVANLLDFFLTAKLYDNASIAIAKWTEKFGKRELKNKILLESIMANLFASIDTGIIEQFLRQTEAAIYFILCNFDTDLTNIIGVFGSDEIVKFEIKSRSDYRAFLEKLEARKCIPLVEFWKSNIKDLDLLISKKAEFCAVSTLQKLYESLMEIKKNLSNSDKFKINKLIGDVVIAVDCPPTFKLLTLDHSFDVICPSINKEHFLLPKN